MPVKRSQRASPASPAARACHQAGRKFKLRLALGDTGPPPALGEPSSYSAAGSSASESGSASASLAAAPLPPALVSTSRRKTRSSSAGSPAANSLDSTASSLDLGKTLSLPSLDIEDCSSASSASRSSSVGLSTSTSSRASSSTAPSEPPSPRSCLKRSLAGVALSDPRSPSGQGKRVRWDNAIARSVPTRRGKYVVPPTKRQKRAKLAAEKAAEDPYVEQKRRRARLRRALIDIVLTADESTDDDASTSCVAAQHQPPHQTYITKADFVKLLSPPRVSPADPLTHASNQRPSSASLPASPIRLKAVSLPTDSGITVVVSPPLNAAPPPEGRAADYAPSAVHLSPDWVPRAVAVESAASRTDEHAASVEQSPLGMHGGAGDLLIDVPSAFSSVSLSASSSAAAAATEPRWDDPLTDVLQQWYDSHEAYGKDGRKGDISIDLTSGAPLRAGDSLEEVARQWYAEYDGFLPGGCFGSS
ncbi:hypothetical protein JCM10449v2_003198 [Rhodotorula kratochvilovae]